MPVFLSPFRGPTAVFAKASWLLGRRQSRDSIRYEEKRGGSVEHVIIDGEMMAVGRHVIYMPTDEEWKNSAPHWAQGRRDEILERVKDILGNKHYAYDYSRHDA